MANLEFNEDMGSLEAHLDILKQRLQTAQDNYDSIVERELGPDAEESAKELVDAAQEALDAFEAENMEEAGN